MCRSRRELSNAYLLAKIGVDTAENEPLEVWGEKFHSIFTSLLKAAAAEPEASADAATAAAEPEANADDAKAAAEPEACAAEKGDPTELAYFPANVSKVHLKY